MTRMHAIVQRNLPTALASAFLAGVLVGLFVLGWWLWPVQYNPATPADLQETWRRSYLQMAADSYAQSGDAESARRQIAGLVGPGGDVSQVAGELQVMAQDRANAQDAQGAARLQALAAVAAAPAGGVPVPGAVPGARAQGSLFSRLLRVCGLVVLVLVILAGLLLLVYFLQSRTTAPATSPSVEARVSAATAPPIERRPVPPPPQAAVAPPAAASTGVAASVLAPPTPGAAALGPFVATYNLGDIDFDMSFGIESPNGDFLGECGLGMAETIGGGEVQRVTAFEVWLFDKTDIRTVSLVLASAHAHTDAALRTKLASRGEVVLAQPGGAFSVKTTSLQLNGRVLDLAYGGGDVPAQSYFTSFSVELAPIVLTEGEGQ